jgi:hypothetical protein
MRLFPSIKSNFTLYTDTIRSARKNRAAAKVSTKRCLPDAVTAGRASPVYRRCFLSITHRGAFFNRIRRFTDNLVVVTARVV